MNTQTVSTDRFTITTPTRTRSTIAVPEINRKEHEDKIVRAITEAAAGVDHSPNRCGRNRANGTPCRAVVKTAGQPCRHHPDKVVEVKPNEEAHKSSKLVDTGLLVSLQIGAVSADDLITEMQDRDMSGLDVDERRDVKRHLRTLRLTLGAWRRWLTETRKQVDLVDANQAPIDQKAA